MQRLVKYVCSTAGRGANCAACGRPAEAPALDQARRRVLLGAAALVALPACEARAAWDGSSAAIGSCPLGDEGDECRRQTLMCDPQHCTGTGSASVEQQLTVADCQRLSLCKKSEPQLVFTPCAQTRQGEERCGELFQRNQDQATCGPL